MAKPTYCGYFVFRERGTVSLTPRSHRHEHRHYTRATLANRIASLDATGRAAVVERAALASLNLSPQQSRRPRGKLIASGAATPRRSCSDAECWVHAGESCRQGEIHPETYCKAWTGDPGNANGPAESPGRRALYNPQAGPESNTPPSRTERERHAQLPLFVERAVPGGGTTRERCR